MGRLGRKKMTKKKTTKTPPPTKKKTSRFTQQGAGQRLAILDTQASALLG